MEYCVDKMQYDRPTSILIEQ